MRIKYLLLFTWPYLAVLFELRFAFDFPISAGSGYNYFPEKRLDEDLAVESSGSGDEETGEDLLSGKSFSESRARVKADRADLRKTVHYCEFNGSLCGWSVDDESLVQFRLPPVKQTEDSASNQPNRGMTVEEAQHFYRDFLYVDGLGSSSTFSMTSPLFTDERSSIRFGGIFCATFSAKIKNGTDAQLILIQTTPTAVFDVLWTFNQSANYTNQWINYYANIKLVSTNFQVKFSVSTLEPVENLASPDDAVFSVGFFQLQYAACEREQLRLGSLIGPGSDKARMLINSNSPAQVADLDLALSGAESKMAVNTASKIWPGGVVPYEISDGYFTNEQLGWIKSAMNDIMNRTCVRFVPHQYSDSYLDISNEPFGCFSYVGYSGSYSYTNFDTSSCWDMRTVRHEILHAIGFYHEHQRPDRDTYIDILWENVRESTFSQFNVYSSADVEIFGLPYDYESVMHYGTKTFSKNGGQTMRPKVAWAVIGAIQIFSPLDIVQIRKLYKCDDPTVVPTHGDYCGSDLGNFICKRYAPCEFGTYGCPSNKVYDSTTKSCKTIKTLGQSCDSTSSCSQTNAECSSSSVCACKTGYYQGPRTDCLLNSQTKKLNEACTATTDCMYELICDSTSTTCVCPSYMTSTNDYTCTKKVFGSSCTQDTDCSQAITGSTCVSNKCACPTSFTQDTYIDTSGTSTPICASSSATKASVGSICKLTTGTLCVNGAICRTCPLTDGTICTVGYEFALAWNSFPNKPPSYITTTAPATTRPTAIPVSLTIAALIITFLHSLQ